MTLELNHPPAGPSRPVITWASPELCSGEPLIIRTADSDIAKVSLVALSPGDSDTEGRLAELPFRSLGGGVLDVTVGQAPIGAYLLFLVNHNGVPSDAKWLKLSPAAPPQDDSRAGEAQVPEPEPAQPLRETVTEHQNGRPVSPPPQPLFEPPGVPPIRQAEPGPSVAPPPPPPAPESEPAPPARVASPAPEPLPTPLPEPEKTGPIARPVVPPVREPVRRLEPAPAIVLEAADAKPKQGPGDSSVSEDDVGLPEPAVEAEPVAQLGTMPRRKRSRVLFFLVLVLVLSALVGLAAMSWSLPEVKEQITKSVVRQPAKFTEMYFTDPERIPKQLSMTAPNEIRFTVVNREGQDMNYPYEVSAQSVHGTSLVGEGVVAAAPGKSADASAQFAPTQPGTKYLITVRLTGRRELIRFYGVS